MALIQKCIQHLISIMLITASINAQCQTPVQQIPQQILPNQIDPRQLTQPQLSALLSDKNKDAGKDKNAELQKKNQRVERDSITYDNNRMPVNDPDKTYGANVFESGPVTDVSELSTPPLDYPIGVGDHIVVALWGAAEFQESYVVGKDGSIFPQGLGKINVLSLTFENARSIIMSRFKSVVPQGTNISVSLGQPRSINVNVVGEVKNPGPQTVSAFANAFNVIGAAGGITDYGNLRSIQIKRNGRLIDELDVYKYLTTGDFGKHIYLQNNDFVIVGFMEKKVLTIGHWKRPMYYQLKKEEGVKALLKYAGGLNADAFATVMKVTRVENEKEVQRDINANAIIKMNNQDFLLQDGDVVNVISIKTGITNKVDIRGEVSYPGIYEFREGDKVFDLINRAGGVTKNTYLQRAYIFRGAGDSTNLKAEKLELNLSDIQSNNSNTLNNVALQPNDVIQLFATAEFTDDFYVEVSGEVRRPGRIRKYGGMTLQDLIYLVGGIKPSAEFGRLEISSIVDVDSAQKGLKPTRNIVQSFAIPSDLSLDSVSSKIILKPYDQIFVRKNPTFELQQNVTLNGRVKYPGVYPKLESQERLSSFIERAGGLSEDANVSGAILIRKNTSYFREKIMQRESVRGGDSLISYANAVVEEPISIDLYNALKYKNSKYDVVLQQNDVVVIPEKNPFVSVQGAVQSPLRITFDSDHKNMGYYIDKAGGYGNRPWKKRIFVTYANGKSKKTRSFLFFKSYPKVEDGSVIYVPVKPKGENFGDFGKTVIIAAIPVILTGIIFKYIK